jgi:hypothetical protein
MTCVLALCAGFAAFVAVPPQQRSTAQVLFVPSIKQPGVDGPTNPFLSLGGSVAIVASLVQIGVVDDETAAGLAADGHLADYEVVPNLSENAGPVLVITTEHTSAAMAQSTLQAVIDVIKEDLRNRQVEQGVRPDLLVTAVVLTSSVKPEVIRKTQIQIAAISTAAVWIVFLALILLMERRRITRAWRQQDAATAPTAGSGEETGLGSQPETVGLEAGTAEEPAGDDAFVTVRGHQ